MRFGKRARSIARRSSLHVPARVDRARDDVARRELVDEALAGVVEQERTVAAQAPRESSSDEPASAVGWNWTNSRSATAAPARYASAMPSPRRRAGWSCAPRAPRSRRSRAASRARGDRAAVGQNAGARPPRPQRRARARPRRRDARVLEHALGENARRSRCPSPRRRRGRRGVASGRPRGPRLVVELDAQLGEVDDPRRRLLGQTRDGRLAAEAAAGRSVSSAWSSGESSSAEPLRRHHPARASWPSRRAGPSESRSTSASSAAQSAA